MPVWVHLPPAKKMSDFSDNVCVLVEINEVFFTLFMLSTSNIVFL